LRLVNPVLSIVNFAIIVCSLCTNSSSSLLFLGADCGAASNWLISIKLQVIGRSY